MDTKLQIIEAALLSFLTFGYEKTSLTGVATSLSITKGAVYHHFASKDELFLACLDAMFSDLEEWFYEHLLNAPDFKSLLECYVDFPAFFKNSRLMKGEIVNVNFYRLMFDASDRIDGFKEKIEASYSGYIELFKNRFCEAQKKGEVRADLDGRLYALEMTAMVEGMIILNVMAPKLSLSGRTNDLFKNLWSQIAVV